jgi:serine/threonine-protein kinase
MSTDGIRCSRTNPPTTRAPRPAPLKREQWARLLPLLGQALDLDSGEPRERWLATLRPGDAQGLRVLLSEHAAIETSDFLQHAAPLLPAATDVAEPWRPGAVVGPWRLLQRRGRGGMAVVWLAERADGRHERRVALKLPTLGGTPALAPRLAREGRILAHPAIAQVLDAGVDGVQPWLALELAQGQPITEHARERGLSIPQRLRLFVAVLRAVAHARAQLVVHRDIKPANFFVTHDGQVKLLDHADLLLAETALTREAGRALTPQYASPEQIAGAPLSTRSDGYSLAVLLYELLTGMLPDSLRRGSAAELEEAVLTAAIRRPSAAAGDKDTARGLRGDIDTMAMKALAHEHPALLRAALARVLTLAGRAAEALPLARSASDEFDRRYAEPTWAREHARWFLAEALIGSGHRAAGVARMKAVRQKTAGPTRRRRVAASAESTRPAGALHLRRRPGAGGLAADARRRLGATAGGGAQWRTARGCSCTAAWRPGVRGARLQRGWRARALSCVMRQVHPISK